MISGDRERRYRHEPGLDVAMPPPTDRSWGDVYYREVSFQLVRQRRDGSWYEAGGTMIGPPVRHREADPLFAVKVGDYGPYEWKYAPIEDEL